MIDAMIKGDYSASLGMYADDAYSLPSYSPMIKGIEAIKKSNMEMANSPMKIKSFELIIKEIIQGGDLYVEVGKYKINTQEGGRSGWLEWRLSGGGNAEAEEADSGGGGAAQCRISL